MKLKVMNFNICCGDDPGDNTIAARAPRVGMIIDRYDPDVIGFQEYTPVWKPLIDGMLGERYEIFNQYRSESNLESTPILWKKERFECNRKGYFWLSDTPEVESRGWDELFNCFRICEYVVLQERMSGICFTHMNTHFGFGDKGQVASARLIGEKSKLISHYPTFVTGDFNMSAGMPGYMEMTKFFCDVNAVTARNSEATFHNYGENDATIEEIFPALRSKGQSILHIDLCFSGDGIVPLKQFIVKDKPGGGFPSDHYALLSELEIEKWEF